MNERDRARVEHWLRKLPVSRPPAVLVGDGTVNDLSFARSLASRGIPTLMLAGTRMLGTYTRRGLVVRLPALRDSQAEWMELLAVVASRSQTPPVLFALSDEHCLWVAHHADDLRRTFRFTLPDAETVQQIVSKREQYALAEAAGIPVPETMYPGSVGEVQRLVAAVRYPLILKPYQSHVGRPRLSNRKVLVVHSRSDLLSEYRRHAHTGTPLMLQEIVPGEDDALFGYGGFWDEDVRERAWFTKQKLRQFPPHFGDGSFQRTVNAPEVADLSRRLLRALGYRGLVGVEFKRDLRDGTYRLMEVNPRTVSGNQLAIRAGVDLPWIAYRYLAGLERTPASAPSFRANIKYVNEAWDVQAFWSLRRSGELSFWSWIRSLRGTKAWAVAAWDDPFPLLVGISRSVSLLLRRLSARLTG
jgi:D-aspartate ligase